MTTTFKEIPVAQVRPDPNNPRKGKLEIDDLVKSIKEIGLVEPIVVRRVGDHYLVVAGHRRLAAIQKLKWPTIGSVIVDGYDDAGALRDAVAENVVRQPLSAHDEMRAMVQLAGLGMTDAEIAEAFARDVTTVKAARSIEDASEKGIAALAKAKPDAGVQLTIEQSAAIARFGGTPAGQQLINEIESGSRYWHSTYQRLERAEKVDENAKKISIDHKGVKKVKSFDGSYNGPENEIEPLVNLTDAKGKKLTTASHKTCPGHAYSIDKPGNWETRTTITVEYWCTDWKANGHKLSKTPKRKWSQRGKQPQQSSASAPREKVTDEIVAAERSLDTAWLEAAARRKDFTTEFIAKPKTAEKFVVFAIHVANDRNLGSEMTEIAADWRTLPLKELVKVVIGAYIIDLEFEIDDWRWSQWQRGRRISYLQFLSDNGHELNETEKLVIDRAEKETPWHTRMEYPADVVDDEWDEEDNDVADDEIVDVPDQSERV